MTTVFMGSRDAYTCGFGPGHHPHPVHTLALAQQPPEVVRIARIDDGLVTLIHEGGAASYCWNHGGIHRALTHSDGVAFLHAGSVLRVGGCLFSVSDEPTPCKGVDAHADPAHPAWAGPSIDATPHETNRDGTNDHYEPGHHLPFWRLEAALACGPGREVDDVDVRNGEVVLEVDGARLRRFNHNPRRITAALSEVVDGVPYRRPQAPWDPPVAEWERWSAPSFGDAPVASLLDDEILRIGDCYFWLGVSEAGIGRCGYMNSTSTQYAQQRTSAKYHSRLYLPAPSERVHITEIARRVADGFDPWFGAARQREETATGVVVPIGDVSTPEARAEAAKRIAGSLVKGLGQRMTWTRVGDCLYGPSLHT
ncbi:MAG: hypothetical protein ACKOZL_09040 [Actinomycetes bacterium]